LGGFIFFKNRKDLSGRLFFLVTLLFALWSFFDLILWSSPDSRKTMFFWSIINLLENMVSCLTVYFVYVFLEKKDVVMKYKVIGMTLFLPFLVLLPTKMNMTGFNATLCEAQQGDLINYFYFLEGVFFLTLLGYGIWKIIKTSGSERREAVYLFLGATLFLMSFSGANIAGSIASVVTPDNPDNWKILQYGLFGMPIFLTFLTYLIVKYQAFDVKLIGAQALVVGLITLIGSQLFFTRELTSYILVAITFILAAIFGIILIRSVKEEVQRKEELQMISDSLASANERLRRLDNAKSEFVSIASHQLRTPITAIKGYISLILEGSYGKVSAEVQDVLEKVYGVQGQLSQLVEDLLNVSRIESGRIQYQYAPTHLEVIVTDLIDMFSITAKDKGIALKMHLSKKVLPELVIDANKIKETLSNLIDNAIKYTTQGEVTVSVEHDDEHGVARVIVEDTGVGISAEDKDRLFEKFVRSKETMQMVTSGTGLGLYVGKNFIEAHGGRIWAEPRSDGGRGSRFIVELPFINPNEGKTEMATFEKSYENYPKAKKS
jgi:signal transduction histidine kinase